MDSTELLADQASAAGLQVRLVIAAASSYDRLPRLTSGLVRVARAAPRVGDLAWRVHDTLSATAVRHQPGPIVRAADVPSATNRVHPAGDLLVFNSLRSLDVGRMLAIARAKGSRTVWYLRETTSLPSVAMHGHAVDVLVANSRPLAAEAERLADRPCAYVPSVLSRDDLVAPSTRTALLAINPVESHGLDAVLGLAELVPDRQIVLQESWPLPDADWADLEERCRPRHNVELRRRTARSAVFRDAYALLLPHHRSALESSRPRVALEAQLLGVPVVAHDLPGLAAVTPSDELRVKSLSPPQWREAIERLDASYDRFRGEAVAFADAEVPTPEQTWAMFADACGL